MLKWLGRLFCKKKQSPQPSVKSIENPYHRFYTKNRSFEELVRHARNNTNTKNK